MVKIGVHKSRQFETNCEITTILWAYSKKDHKSFKRNTIGRNLFYWSNPFLCHVNHDDYVFMKQLFYQSNMKITTIYLVNKVQKRQTTLSCSFGNDFIKSWDVVVLTEKLALFANAQNVHSHFGVLDKNPVGGASVHQEKKT